MDVEMLLSKDVWTVAETAALAGVTTDAVHKWRRRGLLADAGRDWRGRVLVRSADAIRAERATREKARRVYPVAA